MLSYECPNCGAPLSAADDPDFMACAYCGGRFSLASLRPSSVQSAALEQPAPPPEPSASSARPSSSRSGSSCKTPRRSPQEDICRYLIGALVVLFLLLVSCNYG